MNATLCRGCGCPINRRTLDRGDWVRDLIASQLGVHGEDALHLSAPFSLLRNKIESVQTVQENWWYASFFAPSTYRAFLQGLFFMMICVFWVPRCHYQVLQENPKGFWWCLAFMMSFRWEMCNPSGVCGCPLPLYCSRVVCTTLKSSFWFAT